MINKSDFTACAGYVVIEPLDTQQKTTSPFVISDTADKYELARMGRVVSIPKNNTNDEYIPCRVGDIVVHKQWHSENFEFNGKHYQFVKFEDIAAVKNVK